MGGAATIKHSPSKVKSQAFKLVARHMTLKCHTRCIARFYPILSPSLHLQGSFPGSKALTTASPTALELVGFCPVIS